MKRFIITEQEREFIRGLYERVGDMLTQEMSTSPKVKSTKEIAKFLNSYYGINLGAATTGNWQDRDYNDTLKKFMEEKGIPVWVCKKGDGWCNDSDEGEVTTKEYGKLRQAMSSQTNSQDKINTTNDRTYDYKLSNGKYYYSLKGQNKWVEAKGKGLDAIRTKVKF